MLKVATHLTILFCLSLAQKVFAQSYPSLIANERVLGGKRQEDTYGPQVYQDSKGNILFASYTNSDDGDIVGYHDNASTTKRMDVFTAKIDWKTGEPVWIARALGGSEDELPLHVVESEDGKYYYYINSAQSVDGDVSGRNFFTEDAWVVKLDAETGALVWSTRKIGGDFTGSFATGIRRGVEMFDKNLAVASITSASDGDVRGLHASSDVWVFKVRWFSGDTAWTSRALGGSGREELVGLYETQDSSLIVVANTESSDGDVHGFHGQQDIWVAKLHGITLDTIWTKTLGGAGKEVANSGLIAEDGNIIVVGTSDLADGDVSSIQGGTDGWVVKLDVKTGDTLWTSRGLGGSDNDHLSNTGFPGIVPVGAGVSYRAQNAYLTNDGHIVAGGYTVSSDGDVANHKGSADYWAVKLDVNTGAPLIFSNAIGGDMEERISQFSLGYNDGFIFSGDATSSMANGDIYESLPGPRQYFAAHLDSNLDLQWTKVASTSGFAGGGRAFQTPDCGVIMLGTIGNTFTGQTDVWVVKYHWINGDFTFPTTACVGESVAFRDSTEGKTTAQPGVQWHWDFGDGSTSTEENPNHVYFSSDTYQVTMVVQKECEADTVVKNIVISDPISSLVDLGPDTLLCDGDSILLNVADSQLVSYLWKDGSTDSIRYVDSGIYMVAVSDGVCGDVDSIIIETPPPLVISSIGDTFLCEGNPIQLWVSGGSDYLWTPSTSLSDPTIANPITTHPTSITYFVQVSNACENKIDSINLTIADVPSFNVLPEDVTLSLGDSVQLMSSSNDSVFYTWTPALGLSDSTIRSPIAKPNKTTTYELIIQNKAGCSDTVQVLVSVDQNAIMFVPNAFSPNGDEVNDKFTVQLKGAVISCFKLSIYDKFGKQVYEQPCSTVPLSWDGTYNGKLVNAGVYAYHLNVEFEDINVQPIRSSGNVTLIR